MDIWDERVGPPQGGRSWGIVQLAVHKRLISHWNAYCYNITIITIILQKLQIYYNNITFTIIHSYKYVVFVAKNCKCEVSVTKICKHAFFVAKICNDVLFVGKICKLLSTKLLWIILRSSKASQRLAHCSGLTQV